MQEEIVTLKGGGVVGRRYTGLFQVIQLGGKRGRRGQIGGREGKGGEFV